MRLRDTRLEGRSLGLVVKPFYRSRGPRACLFPLRFDRPKRAATIFFTVAGDCKKIIQKEKRESTRKPWLFIKKV
jgi:hypothetical protein